MNSAEKMQQYQEATVAASAQGLVKVGADLPNGSREWCWCQPVPGTINRFRVDNVPFFVNCFSFGDIIEAVKIIGGDRYHYARTVKRSRRNVRFSYDRFQNPDERATKWPAFNATCDLKDIKVEGMMEGIAVASVPNGKVKAMKEEIRKVAEEVGLKNLKFL